MITLARARVSAARGGFFDFFFFGHVKFRYFKTILEYCLVELVIETPVCINNTANTVALY